MVSVDIIVKTYDPFRGNKYTYNTANSETIDIVKVKDKPNGYVYHNHKPVYMGKYTINSIKMETDSEKLDFDVHFPINNVTGFFVYYQHAERDPLLICIQTMDSNEKITYRYFCPRHKNRKSWMIVPDLVIDPKLSGYQQEIKNKLDQQVKLMAGVNIHIEKTYDYNEGKVTIKTSHLKLSDYQVYTHELESQEPFHVNQINFNDKLVEIKSLPDYQIICVHVFISKPLRPFNPVAICVVKYTEKSNPNIYDWYFRDNWNSYNWTQEERFSEYFDCESIKKYINKLYDDIYDITIDIDEKFFYYSQTEVLNINGIKRKISFHEISTSKFKKYIYSLDIDRHFNIKNLTIHNKQQLNLPKRGIYKLYIFCDEKNDKEHPLFICFLYSNKSYRWYRLRHFASDYWVECDELQNYNPENNVGDSALEEAYNKLFWIDLDINREKILEVQQYNKNSRFIGKKITARDGYEVVEISNYNSYPFYVRIVEDGKQIKEIKNEENIISVSVFYFSDKKPMFVSFEHLYGYKDQVWYSRDDENSNTWSLNDKLKGKNPMNHNYVLLPPQHKKVLLDEEEIKETENRRSIAAQTVGTTVGTAACCGAGYMIYTNANTIGNMVTSFFR